MHELVDRNARVRGQDAKRRHRINERRCVNRPLELTMFSGYLDAEIVGLQPEAWRRIVAAGGQDGAEPLYAFGVGLSYTTYSGAAVAGLFVEQRPTVEELVDGGECNVGAGPAGPAREAAMFSVLGDRSVVCRQRRLGCARPWKAAHVRGKR